MEKERNLSIIKGYLFSLFLLLILAIGISVYFTLGLLWQLIIIIGVILLLLSDFIVGFFPPLAVIEPVFTSIRSSINFFRLKLIISIVLLTWLKIKFEIDIIKLFLWLF